MSKTYRYLVAEKFTGEKAKKRRGEASARFDKVKRKDTDKLFKRELRFTTWLERTSNDS